MGLRLRGGEYAIKVKFTETQIKLLEKEKEVTGKNVDDIVKNAIDQYFWEDDENIGLHGRFMSYEQMQDVLGLQH